MSKETVFGKTCITAVKLIADEKTDPEKAWKRAIQVYTHSPKTQIKSCPKNAFVDLCASGYIKGIKKQNDIALSENGKISIEAINILKTDNWKIKSKSKFWSENFNRSHQGQLDVILALKENNLLVD